MNTNNIKILDNNMKYLDHKKESGVIGDDIDKRVSDLETKLKDMNILDMFKGLGGEDGDNANIVKLINGLDSRFSDKINLIEERLKKMEETSYKNNRDVQKVLNTFDLNKRNSEHMKESIQI